VSGKKKGPKILREAVVEVGTKPTGDEVLQQEVLESAVEKVPIDQLAADQIVLDEIVDIAGFAESAEIVTEALTIPEDAGADVQYARGEEIEAESTDETPRTGLWPIERLRPVLEAVVFAAADALPVRRMRDVIEGSTTEEIKAALSALQADYAQRGIRLIEVAGGWQLRTAPEHHDVVRKLFKERPFKLSRAAIETLAVVAYRQPVTRAEVESVRGVDASGVLESLVERHLIRIAGRRDVPGRPLVYTTTHEFLETFGLKDLKSLPTLPELGDDIRAMAEQSGFNEAAEDRDAAILPLEAGEENSGDEQQAARTVERTDPVDEREHDEAPGELGANAETRDFQESRA
jgi:segregation and condensation protein B